MFMTWDCWMWMERARHERVLSAAKEKVQGLGEPWPLRRTNALPTLRGSVARVALP